MAVYGRHYLELTLVNDTVMYVCTDEVGPEIMLLLTKLECLSLASGCGRKAV